jgi:hypothetical protein
MANARPTPSLRFATSLLLAACGPGQAEPDGGSGSGTSATDSATGDTPTSGASGDSGETTGGPRRSRVIGLGFVQATQVWDTVELDLATGELTVLDTLPASIQSIQQGIGAFDPATRRIFQISGDNNLFTLDGDSGAFLGVTPLQSGELSSVGNLAVNNAGELVGLAFGGTFHTVTIDPDTGAVTPLAALPPGIESLTQGNTAFDPASNRIFELTGDDHLLVIDAATGVLVGDTVVMPVGPSGLLELAVNNAGELMGLTTPLSPGPWDVVRVDPLTGLATVQGQLSTPGGIVQGQTIHDPALDRMFVMTSDDRLHEIDASTGAELSTTLILPGNHVGLFNPELVP